MTATQTTEQESAPRSLQERVQELEARCEQQQAKIAALSRAETLLQAVSAHAPIVLWAIDRDGRFTLSEGHGLRALGLKPGEYVGQSVYTAYQDVPSVLNSVGRALAGETVRSTMAVGELTFDSWMAPVRGELGTIDAVMGVATDVTERVLAEAAVRESEERFSKAFHASPVALTITRFTDGRIIDVNESFVRLSGLSREVVLGRTSLELRMWADPAERDALIGALERDGRVRDRECHIVRPDGVERIARVSVELVEIGGVPCMLSIAHDITELARAEAEVRASRQHFATLARVAPAGIFRADAAGRCIYVNQHLCTLTGLDAEQILGEGWAQSIHPGDCERVYESWQHSVAEGTAYRQEYRYQRPDGAVVWALCLAEPDRAAGGEIEGYVGTVLDISLRRQAEDALQQLNSELEARVEQRTQQLTRANRVLEEQIVERKRVYAALEESEGKWRSLVENAPDVIATVSRAGTLQFVNQTSPGIDPQQVLGRSIFEFISPEFHETTREALAVVFEEGRTASREITARGPGERLGWYSAHVGPIRQREQVTAATVICRDITDRKQAEQDAEQRQAELAHFSRLSTIGEMAAALAHELNQPLAAIANYASGCTRRLQTTHSELTDILGALQEVASEAHRASEIIRRLRNFLRKCDMKHALVDSDALSREAAELAQAEARKEDVRIRLRLAESVPPVLADGIQIEQVMLNLLLNAIEAMKDAPADRRVVRIRTRYRETEGLVQFTITDGGSGLPAEGAERIFEPFFTTKPQGLGMGLSISRSIVDAHGGRLWATANEASGATFRFVLPARPEPANDDR